MSDESTLRADLTVEGSRTVPLITPVTRTSERGGSPMTGGPCSISANDYILDLELDLAL